MWTNLTRIAVVVALALVTAPSARVHAQDAAVTPRPVFGAVIGLGTHRWPGDVERERAGALLVALEASPLARLWLGIEASIVFTSLGGCAGGCAVGHEGVVYTPLARYEVHTGADVHVHLAAGWGFVQQSSRSESTPFAGIGIDFVPTESFGPRVEVRYQPWYREQPRVGGSAVMTRLDRIAMLGSLRFGRRRR